jgi:hypothetical protein
MPLPTGTWKATVNGAECDFIVEAPNAQGVFQGKMFETPVRGFWDETSQKITFTVTVFFGPGFPTIAFFTGYLFRTPPNAPPGRDVLATVTGSVQANVGDAAPGATFPALGTARRNVYGWFAQITEVL